MFAVIKEYQHYKRLIYLKKGIFLLVALLAMTTAIAVSYLIPKKYEAKTTIFIQQNVLTDLVKGLAVSPSVQNKIQTLAVRLTSRNLLLQVIKDLDQDMLLPTRNDQEAYIKDLQNRIMVNLNEKQGVVIISFWDRSSYFAKNFINTLASLYIEQNTSIKREESTEATKFLAEQIEVYKKRLAEADVVINNFKSENTIILTSDEAYLRTDIREAEQKIVELKARQTQIEAKQNLALNAKAPVYRSNVSQRQAELNRLLHIYTEKHPKVIRARAALLVNRSSSAGNGAGAGARDGAPPSRLLQAEIDTVKSMLERQNKIIEGNMALLRERPRVMAALDDLIAKKNQDAALYGQLVTRYGQSEISKDMELKDKSTVFRIIDPAVAPEVPVSPNRPVIILIGILLGLVAGVAAVILSERYDHSIRSLQELRTLGLPVFAVIPLMTTAVEAKQQAKRNRLVLAMAGGYFVLVLGVLAVESLKAMGVTGTWLQKIGLYSL
ncbi:XrtA system polysaccharide chain length determinant [Solidesulfovibrio sp.]|uniref:XrtA system polysaccharide chain length determinant n=1 Tax=Solidesulfovibrio sp. TaxID=2910990 RepID=UPI0026355B8D|nr:XrtA system polysaccharide chain length determinant [Solidesulfovibrio sp.]